MLFVALGVLLAGAAVVAAKPAILDVLLEPTPSRGAPESTADTTSPPRTAAPTNRTPPEPTTPTPVPPVVLVPVPDLPPDPEPVLVPSASDWVAVAQTALATKHWRDPPEESLALALQNIALTEPGNAAIGKLRQSAADALLPGAQSALERRKWTEAAEDFRNLVSVWPEHPDARAGLAEALFSQARVFKRQRDWQSALTTADELLNVMPGDFRALLLRADALFALKRWREARDAYAEARKIKPRNKDVNKGFWKAAQMARKTG